MDQASVFWGSGETYRLAPTARTESNVWWQAADRRPLSPGGTKRYAARFPATTRRRVLLKGALRTDFRVRYGETDQMGVVYHSNYVVYFELGRTDFMRRHGVEYAGMEREDMVLAVVDMRAQFHRSAVYDDLLTVETRLVEATGVKVRFEYRIFRGSRPGEDGEETLLCSGYTVLVCVNRETARPMRIKSPWRERIAAAVVTDAPG
jgi:acyl-CoA thioester hydrolase